MQREPLSKRARGRWRGILPSLGVDGRYLTGKHGPCPICRDGKDRFRFDDKDGAGTFFCSHCGAGDGVKLVMLVNGYDFREAASRIEEHIGNSPVVQPRQGPSERQKREAMNRLWRASRLVHEGDPVSLYLTRRVGRIAIPEVLRTVERCRYQDDLVSYHPAMLAMIQDASGAPVLLHRTYLTETGQKADVPAPRRLMSGDFPPGSAVRLGESGNVLGIGEGIETCLSAAKLFGLPVWAALNTSLLAQWTPPAGVEEVIVFADNDVNYAGQKAAYELAFRLSGKIKVSVKVPPLAGQDWNDVLHQGAERAAA